MAYYSSESQELSIILVVSGFIAKMLLMLFFVYNE